MLFIECITGLAEKERKEKMKAEQEPVSRTSDDMEHHVLIFPCPAQGHVNSMLNLAQILTLHNLHVTFLNTEHIHHSLTRFADLDSLLARYPTLHFKTIPDGLPDDHPRFGLYAADALRSVKVHCKNHLREILVSESDEKPRITCFIADGYFGGVATDVADEVGIPIIHFRTISASCFWAYFCVPKLFQSNELPVRGEEDMDRVIRNIPGMENLLRCRDLPSFCRNQGPSIIPLDDIVFETHQSLRARALIINTFDHLESPVLSEMRNHHFPNLFTVGPLHAHPSKTMSFSNNSLLLEDRSCMAWLDSQPARSVVYVSFGSITTMTRENFIEIWYGLVNSKRRFLWVVRGDMVGAGEGGDDGVPAELVEGTKERGMMVSWAPQVEVLGHWAVGGFMTHSGWNSTLESIVAGVPMICWPYFADQQVNSRLVSEAWKVGLDMKDLCHRSIVETMLTDLMLHRKQHFLESAKVFADLARISLTQGGSSCSNIHRLVHFIKSNCQPTL